MWLQEDERDGTNGKSGFAAYPAVRAVCAEQLFELCGISGEFLCQHDHGDAVSAVQANLCGVRIRGGHRDQRGLAGSDAFLYGELYDHGGLLYRSVHGQFFQRFRVYQRRDDGHLPDEAGVRADADLPAAYQLRLSGAQPDGRDRHDGDRGPAAGLYDHAAKRTGLSADPAVLHRGDVLHVPDPAAAVLLDGEDGIGDADPGPELGSEQHAHAHLWEMVPADGHLCVPDPVREQCPGHVLDRTAHRRAEGLAGGRARGISDASERDLAVRQPEVCQRGELRDYPETGDSINSGGHLFMNIDVNEMAKIYKVCDKKGFKESVRKHERNMEN